MSTLASDTAHAAASLPSQTMSLDFGLRTALMSGGLRNHFNRTLRALGGANAATLAGLEVEVEPGRFFHHALHRAVEPAYGTFDALGAVDHRSHAAPVPRQHRCGLGRDRTQVV